MRRLAYTLAVLLWIFLVSLCLSIAAAAIDVESIVVTWVLCSAIGLIVAIAGGLYRSYAVPVLGLSVLALSVSIFQLIVRMRWSPREAQVPVTSILLGYEMIVAPLVILVIYLTLRDVNAIERPKLQFNLRSLMAFTLLVALDLAITRAAFSAGIGATPLRVTAVGLAVASILVAATVTNIALRNPPQAALDIPFQLEGTIPP